MLKYFFLCFQSKLMQNCVHVTVKKKIKKKISAHKGKGTKAAGEIKHMHQVFTLDIKRI